MVRVCMQDTFARAHTRPKGQARATIGYRVYKVRVRVGVFLLKFFKKIEPAI